MDTGWCELSRLVVFSDNLSSEESENFKQIIVKLKVFPVWVATFYRHVTVCWQGNAQIIKQLIGKTYRNWLDTEGNTYRWFANEELVSKIAWRIFLTHLAVETCKAFIEGPKNEKRRWRTFQGTKCLLTEDGLDDNLVTPEGLPDY